MSSGPTMRTFWITVEKIPGDRRTEEQFSYDCDTVDQAWDYARNLWRVYGPSTRVVHVKQIGPWEGKR